MKANALLIEDQEKFLTPAQEVLEWKWFNVHVARTLTESMDMVRELLKIKYRDGQQLITVLDTGFPLSNGWEENPQAWRDFLCAYRDADNFPLVCWNPDFFKKIFIPHAEGFWDNLNMLEGVNWVFRSSSASFAARKNERASILWMKVDEILSHEEYFRVS